MGFLHFSEIAGETVIQSPDPRLGKLKLHNIVFDDFAPESDEEVELHECVDSIDDVLGENLDYTHMVEHATCMNSTTSAKLKGI